MSGLLQSILRQRACCRTWDMEDPASLAWLPEAHLLESLVSMEAVMEIQILFDHEAERRKKVEQHEVRSMYMNKYSKNYRPHVKKFMIEMD